MTITSNENQSSVISALSTFTSRVTFPSINNPLVVLFEVNKKWHGKEEKGTLVGRRRGGGFASCVLQLFKQEGESASPRTVSSLD